MRKPVWKPVRRGEAVRALARGPRGPLLEVRELLHLLEVRELLLPRSEESHLLHLLEGQ